MLSKMVEQPKPNGGDVSIELPFTTNARRQQNPIVNKTPSSTNPCHQQTLVVRKP